MTILPTTRKTESGFTLVELAIVLMIIGLLIGGILRGQELMENARVTSTIQQTKAYDGAVTTFRDAYNYLPGDLNNNTSPRLANCTTTLCTNNVATAGDGIVGTGWTSYAASYTIGPENQAFWIQLSVARLISGVDSSADSTKTIWGQLYPAAKIGGGFHVVYVNVAGSPSGHAIVLRNAAAAATVEGSGTAPVSPLRAAQMDRKIDDGLPATGDVVGLGTGCRTAATPPAYDETSEQRNCMAVIRVQN